MLRERSAEGMTVGFCPVCAQKASHTHENTDSTKRPTPDSAGLFTLAVRSYSSYPPPVRAEAERGVVGERGREAGAEPLTCC